MKRSALKNLKLYPHFKLTNEKFPRLLVTRKIENDNAEYFGAFLPKTGARVLLGFVNKIFKLRSCEIDIDKGLILPCPMFYRKRCLAPCVENICDEEEYAERVQFLRLFLSDERVLLEQILTNRIEQFSETFDFETAAEWRDFLFAIEELWKNKRSQYWLSKAIDTWEMKREKSNLTINLVTQRGQKILGNRSFLFEIDEDENVGSMIEKIFSHFYKCYVPKEIRVFEDFDARQKIAKDLSNKFGRKVQINIQKELTPTTKKGLMKTNFDSVIEKISSQKTFKEIQKILKKEFKLNKIPNRIEAYDVAHISGKNIVAAKIVWEKGKLLNHQNEAWQFDEISEPNAITEAIKQRFSIKDTVDYPDLILIDGGKTQINAAIEGIKEIKDRKFKIISAVKPKGRHNEVSHFLNEKLNRIEIEDSGSFHLLTNLRDYSHDLANRTHASIRDTNHFYELATLLPNFSERERRDILKKTGSIRALNSANLDRLKSVIGVQLAEKVFAEINDNKDNRENLTRRLVPIRFDADGGNAEDLQPIGI